MIWKQNCAKPVQKHPCNANFSICNADSYPNTGPKWEQRPPSLHPAHELLFAFPCPALLKGICITSPSSQGETTKNKIKTTPFPIFTRTHGKWEAENSQCIPKEKLKQFCYSLEDLEVGLRGSEGLRIGLRGSEGLGVTVGVRGSEGLGMAVWRGETV